MKYLFAFILTFTAALVALGRTSADTVKVYFRASRSNFDPSLADNGAEMAAFIDHLRMAMRNGEVERVDISGFASPEGSDNVNRRLSQKRCETIESYIIRNTGIESGLVHINPQGIAWKELTELVERTPEVPNRKRVLEILHNTPVWIFDSNGRVVDGRNKRLMDLAGGRPYNWMAEHLFPQLRNAVAVTVSYVTPGLTLESHSTSAAGNVADASEEARHPSRPIPVPGFNPVPPYADLTAHPAPQAVSVASPYHPRHLFALKTNFIYYGILMPNLELEWLINPHWSVAVEGDVAWYERAERNQIYKLAIISAEAKRWIKPKKPWHGLYVGIMAGIGWYDLENGGTGYRGEGAMAGPTVGYMWPISRYFSLEGELGAGVMRTRIKEYEPRDGHHMFTRNRKLTYFGPLKLSFSIAWRFGDISKANKKN